MTNSQTNSIPNTTSRVNAFTGISRRRRKFQLIPANGDGSTLSLDFTTGVLDPRLTFTRTSTATFINSSGLVQFANANLMTYSTPRASGSAWATTGTVTWGSATITNPNGDATAQEVIFGTNGAIFNVSGTTVTSGITHTFSVWLRAATGTTNVRLGGANAVVSTVTLTTTWQRFSIQYTTTTTTEGGAVFSQTGSPSGTVYVWGAQVQPGSLVGELLETTGTLRRNIPRFDHDPTTLAPRGLLIEGQATNLVLRSQEFNTLWTQSRMTVSPDSITSPDGTVNADTIIEDVNSNTHGVWQTVTVTSGASYTLSCFIKKGTTRYVCVGLWDSGANNSGAQFDLDNVTATAVWVGSYSAATNATITSMGNNWYRCSVTCVAKSTSEYPAVTHRSTATSAGSGGSIVESYTGSTGNYTYVYGFQMEAGLGASSYIPTGASQVTRTKDDCELLDLTTMSFNANEGTILTETGPRIQTGSNRNYTFLPASGGNNQMFEGSGIAFNVFSAGSFVAQIGSTNPTLAQKVAAAYALNDYAVSVAGGAVATDTSGALPTALTKLTIGGSIVNSAGQMFGCIRRFKYWPTRLSDAQLQSLTT